jgi:Membrane bound beta barrel domain (DUF5777)
MRIVFTALAFCLTATLWAQDTPPPSDADQLLDDPEKTTDVVRIFKQHKLINARTSEVVKKGEMEFEVQHNFNDIGGSFGGPKKFFGLDENTDLKIGFQFGLGHRFTLVTSRVKGATVVRQLFELGFKYQIARQIAKDPKHPLAVTLFANNVTSAVTAASTPGQEHSFTNFGDRNSQVVQLILAKKIGTVSLLASPTFVHRNFVMPGDEKSIFALGGGARIPLTKKFVFLVDYFHTFRSTATRSLYRSVYNRELYDALGVGFEINTPGHTFTLNFCNNKDVLENRFIARTLDGWGMGAFRWSFDLTRAFVLFRPKK